jgi:hypothetical protein
MSSTHEPSKPKRKPLGPEEKIKKAAYDKVYSAAHRLEAAAYNKAYKLANPDKTKNTQLLLKYGISLDQWNEMFDAQGRVCAICSTDTPASKKGWATDHCHTTGRIRGILCSHCNVMLGMSCDNPATLIKAAAYLGT